VQGCTCNFRHEIPTIEDEIRVDLAHDVFGRERHRTERTDMGGVGSFSKENRTLFIADIATTIRDIEEVLKKHFAPWGPIEYIRYLSDKSVAFVRYQLRSTAEFAKVAMMHQTLDGKTVTVQR
jgi:hypothetical protein